MPEKTKPADQPASPSKRDAAKPTHGRRAADGDDEPALGGDMESPKKAFNETSADAGGVEDVQTIGRDDATGPAAPDQIAMTEEAVEELQQEVAPAPVDYHTTMPKIADLEAAGPGGAKWAPAMQAQNAAGSSGEEGGDIDLTVLTGVLCAELDDEDEPWVPEVMLVQLTSELIDAQTADVEDVEEDGVQLDASAGDPGNRATSTAVVGGTSTNPTTSTGSAGPSPTSSQPNISAAGRRRGNY
uniref:Uncharacterized protein n=1 Tax=Neobodo designis TaxID=312471 RepID=A0A7S1PVY2_NEODS|mmetsp:Transcript_22729/g.70433  ORF Transcript_22729/g.70433 Transcript_22729/m.70433 type:complete len:243 (+) Transcript_22729:46-774(+)